MSDAKQQNGKRKPTDDGTDLRFAGVEFNPAPDAQDRLRRLFTILAGHFAERDADEKQKDRATDEYDLGAK